MRTFRSCLYVCLILAFAAGSSCGRQTPDGALEGTPPGVAEGNLYGVADMGFVLEHFPVFESRTGLVSVPSGTVSYLQDLREPIRLKLFLGTWCRDSQTHVPHLFKALRQAENRRIELQIVGMDRRKQDRDGFVSSYDIAFTPTLVVEHEGRELGRIVEVPVDDMATDLVHILQSTLSR